jgi:hypothetical protein
VRPAMRGADLGSMWARWATAVPGSARGGTSDVGTGACACNGCKVLAHAHWSILGLIRPIIAEVFDGAEGGEGGATRYSAMQER